MQDQIQVLTGDNQQFSVLYTHAKHCSTIKGVVDDCGLSHTVPLPNISGADFAKVIEYHKLCEANPLPIVDPKEVTPLKKHFEPTEWQMQYVQDASGPQLNQLTQAANYLEDKELLDFLCNYIAHKRIVGRTPKDVYGFCGMEGEPTDADVQEMLEDPDNAFLKEEP